MFFAMFGDEKSTKTRFFCYEAAAGSFDSSYTLVYAYAAAADTLICEVAVVQVARTSSLNLLMS